MDGNPTHVTDFLPDEGEVSAHQFAQSAIRADGWPIDEPFEEGHLQWLQTRFIEHMGCDTVDSAKLIQNLRRPFESAGA